MEMRKTMIKGYYVHCGGRIMPGISKKIDMQLAELSKHFDISEISVQATPRTLIERIWGLLPFANNAWNYSEALEQMQEPQFVYMRRTVADRAQLKFYREIKRRYPSCKIIVEIFTYPYDRDEFLRKDAWPFWIKDFVYRNHWKKYVDRIVTYTKDKEIFGIPTICTQNGIQINNISIRNPKTENDDVMHILAVAYMQKQHGYERVIIGLANYYKAGGSRNIRIHMVGEGPEIPKYKKLVNKNNLQEHVIFYGKKLGNELDMQYDECPIALGVFGGYKNHLRRISALKTREYLAKGTIVISGICEDIFEKHPMPYFLEFSNDSSSINMEKVIDFYDNIFSNQKESEVASKIRDYALKYVGMDQALIEIVQYIKRE